MTRPATGTQPKLCWASGFLVGPVHAGDVAWTLRYWPTAPGEGTPLIVLETDTVCGLVFAATSVFPEVGHLVDELAASHLVELLEAPDRCMDLGGMFALVARDRRTGRLLAACDRLGVQGLYTHVGADGGLWCASNPLMLMEAVGHDGRADPAYVVEQFGFGYVATPGRTLYRDIAKLPPGHCLLFDGAMEVRALPYRDGAFFDEDDLPAVAALLVERLREHVRRTAVDLPLCLGITAGKDSLLLTAAMRDRVPPAVAATYGEAGWSDLRQGAALAGRLGWRHVAGGIAEAGEFAALATHIAVFSAGTYPVSGVDFIRFLRQTVPPRTVFVIGEAGSTIKNWTDPTSLAGVEAFRRKYCTPVDALGRVLRADFSPALRDFPERTLARLRDLVPGPVRPDDEDVLYWFYWYCRLPSNGSMRCGIMNPLRPLLCPLLDHDIMKLARRIPSAFRHRWGMHRLAVQTASPDLLPFFDPPRTTEVLKHDWGERFRLGVGDQVRQILRRHAERVADVADPEGLARLCDDNRSRPTRDIHLLFRMVSLALARAWLAGDAAVREAARVPDPATIPLGADPPD